MPAVRRPQGITVLPHQILNPNIPCFRRGKLVPVKTGIRQLRWCGRTSVAPCRSGNKPVLSSVEWIRNSKIKACPEWSQRIRLILPAIRYTQYDIRIHYQAQLIEKRTLCRCEKRSDEAISPFSTAPLSWFFTGHLYFSPN